MKSNLYCRFLTLTLLFAAFCANFTARASHIAGASLTYTHISGNTYQITLELLGDCFAPADIFAQLSVATPFIIIYNDTTQIDTLTLRIDHSKSNIEITPNCTLEPTSCTSTSSQVPGKMKFVYTGQITLPYPANRWRIVFEGLLGGGYLGSRSNNVTNISTSGGGPTQIEAILNNSSGDNSSTIIHNDPPIYFCINQSGTYNPSITDIDGDSISVSLVPGINGSTGLHLSYLSPFTYSNPISVSGSSFACSAATGIMNFTPNQLQVALVVYRIDEYRGTTFVGSSEKEMDFWVMTCIDNGCSLLGVEAEHAARKLHCYPNPASDEITLTLPYFTDKADITITDVLGRIVFKKLISDHSQTSCALDVSQLLQGTYYLRVNVGGAVQTESISIW